MKPQTKKLKKTINNFVAKHAHKINRAVVMPNKKKVYKRFSKHEVVE